MLTGSQQIETVLSGDTRMARVDLPERPRTGSAGSKDVDTLSPVELQPRAGGRWWKILLFLLVVAVFLPSLLTVSGQSHAVLKKLHPSLAKAVEYRTLTLHWWSPVEVQDILIRDLSTTTSDSKRSAESEGDGRSAEKNTAEGRKSELPAPLAEIRSLRTTEPLWQLVLEGGRGIHLSLEQPRLKLVVEPDGSNVEKTIASVFGQNQNSASTDSAFPFTAKVNDGQVLIASTRTLVTGISGEIVSGSGKTILPDLRLTARVEDLSQPEVAARYSKSRSERKNNRPPGDEASSVVSQKEKAAPPARIAANLRDLASDIPALPLDSESLTSEYLPADVTPDSVRAEKQNAVPPVESSDDSSAEENANIRITIAAVPERSGRQTVRVAAKELNLRLIDPILTSLTQDYQCDGIVSCDLEAELVGRTMNDGVVGRVRFDSEKLRVRSRNWADGEWLSPGRTKISGAVAMAQDGFLLNQFRIQSEIAEATGEGEIQFAPPSAAEQRLDVATEPATSGSASSSEVKLQGSVDVAKIVAMIPVTLQMHRDVSLTSGRVSFSFQGGKNLSSQPENGGPAAAGEPFWKGMIQTENIQAVRAGQPLRIDSDIRVSGTGPFRNGSPTVSTMSLKAGFGKIDCRPQDGGYLLSGTIQPDQLWLQLQQVMVFPQPGIRGPLTFQSQFHYAPEVITLSETRVQSSDLKIGSDGLRILPSEPLTSMAEGRIHVEGSGNAIRTLIAPWHTADWLSESSSVSIDIDADPRKQTRLRAIIQPGQVASVPRGRVKSVSRRVTGAVTPQLILNEGNLDILLEPSKIGDGVEIRTGVIRIPGVQSAVSGTVETRGAEIILDLTADTQYDLEVLSDRLLSQESPVMLRGTGRDVFRITGSPSRLAGSETASSRMRSDGCVSSDGRMTGTGSARQISLKDTTSKTTGEPVANSTSEIQPLRASGKLSWESGILWGLTLGSGTLDALLENGVVRTQPIQCSISTGELNVVPRLDLVGQRLQFGTGSRVQNIELTPELCREWLGYLAPLLAETADVSGLVSARVERFDYDLNGPENSDIAAVVTIHQAQATPGPSLAPMLQGLELLRKKEKSQGILDGRALTLPSQDVAVQLSQGMVQHQGLKIEIAGYQAHTSGAVGLNRQLQLNLDLPLEKASATGTTRARSVRIPIQGTIDQPLPDVSGMVQNLGTGAIQEKVDEVINNKLDEQLNKLFKKF